MNASARPSPAWSARTWWCVVLALFCLQLGLLFWLGSRQPVKPRAAIGAPEWRFAGPTAAEWLALQDPTLFVHGHARGFAGAAWMPVPVPAYQPPESAESPRWLALDARPLGEILRQYVQANPAMVRMWLSRPAPPLAQPAAGATSAIGTASAVRVVGDLAGRQMLSKPFLRGWEQADLLTNSVVRVLVDAAGLVVSPVLLASSGRPEADALALEVAREVRFEPLRGGSPPASGGLCSGELVFEWQTLPVAPTNEPVVKP